jgi:hypothetical protein
MQQQAVPSGNMLAEGIAQASLSKKKRVKNQHHIPLLNSAFCIALIMPAVFCGVGRAWCAAAAGQQSEALHQAQPHPDGYR